MLAKCIGTSVFARALAAHPAINVNCSAVPGHPNAALREASMFLGLPAPLFTINFEPKPGTEALPRDAFKAFFDLLEPTFGLQVSLGQTNTVVLCPALTSHSELSDEALREAGITRTTIRIAVGNEDPRALLAHFERAAELAFGAAFVRHFMAPDDVDRLYDETYLDVHRRYLRSRPRMAELLT
jgi:cystathionine beta-lyase/cystathionine gamma-synthase